MDPVYTVLNPRIIRLGNRCYRDNTSFGLSEWPSKQPRTLDEQEACDNVASASNELASQMASIVVSDELEIGQLHFSVKPDYDHEAGYFLGVLEVPTYFHPFIIGKSHSTVSMIEKDTSSKVSMPKPGSMKPKAVKITCSAMVNLVRACNMIASVVVSSRKRADPSHYLSMPAGKQVRANLLMFTDKTCVQNNIDQRAYMTPEKAHFTICTLFLADDYEVSVFRKLISEFIKTPSMMELFQPGPLKLTIQGVEIMNDEPEAARVLYAKLQNNEEADRFQKLANALYEESARMGFVAGYNHPNVKLHMTVINSKRLAKCLLKEELGPRTDALSKLPKHERIRKLDFHTELFDFRPILKRFANFTFARDACFDEFELAIRGLDPEHIYSHAARILFPKNADAKGQRLPRVV